MMSGFVHSARFQNCGLLFLEIDQLFKFKRHRGRVLLLEVGIFGGVYKAPDPGEEAATGVVMLELLLSRSKSLDTSAALW